MEAAQAGEQVSQYLIFEVAGEHYAIGILQVKEILSYSGATNVPLTSKAIRGLINLRGNAVPVIDVAVRFKLPPTEVSRRTCVVITDVSGAVCSDDLSSIGLLADSVSNVIELDPGAIEPAPSFGMGVRSDFLQGLATVDGEFVPIIDIQQVTSIEDDLSMLDVYDLEASLPDETSSAGAAERGTEGAPKASLPDTAGEALLDLMPDSVEEAATASDAESAPPAEKTPARSKSTRRASRKATG